MRLIDELTLQRELFCRIQKNAIDSGMAHFDSYKNWCLFGSEVEKAISDIFSQVNPFCPTIDPENLPIVRQLREELERVTKEREAAIADLRERSIESYAECMYCKHIGEKGVCFDCTNGINWEWRGIQEAQDDE